MTDTRRALDRLRRPLGWRARAAGVALAVGGGALGLGAGVWAARLGWLDRPGWVFVAWAAALLVGVGAAILVGSWSRGFGTRAVARWLESGAAWRRGSLTGLLEPVAPGTSDALLRAADAAQRADLERRGPGVLAPLRRRAAALVLGSGGVAVAGLATLWSAGPLSGARSPLWRPLDAWRDLRAPVRLVAGRTRVDEGARVTLRIEAPGRSQADLWLRSPGTAWERRVVALDSGGAATVLSEPLRADLYARATSGGRGSDTVRVQVRFPVLLRSLALTAHYPAYLGLEDEPLPTDGDTLTIPAGTRLELTGQLTTALAAAGWRLDRDPVRAFAVRGDGFTAALLPPRSGTVELILTPAGDQPLDGGPIRLPIRLVADSAPRVDIPVPGRDTVAPLSLKVPLTLDARDDHGLTSVTLELRRRTAAGGFVALPPRPIALPGGRPDRAILGAELDLGALGLAPGDTLRYRARVVDNSPARQWAVSAEYSLRLPTGGELRAAQRASGSSVASQLDSVAAAAREAARQTEDLARERWAARGDSAGGDRNGPPLSYEQAQRAEQAARTQTELVRQADALRRQLDALDRGARAAGLDSPEWRQQLDAIRKELDRALTPDLRDKLAALQQALQRLDPEATQQALRDLAEAQRQLREALERSREMFQRAALEGDLRSLAADAKDLAKEQGKWNESLPGSDRTRAAARERELAARADSLAASVNRSATQADSAARADSAAASGLAHLAAQARAASGQMRQAARNAQAGREREAASSGEQAEAALEDAGSGLDLALQSLQQAWRSGVSRALDQALAEVSRLSQGELALERQFRAGAPPSRTRSDQAALEEGVRRVQQQVQDASGKNALVSPRIPAALSVAGDQMARAREAVSSSAPDNPSAADRAGGAVDALNQVAYQLARARAAVSGAASGSGLGEALEQMARLAARQGQLGQQGQGLLPLIGQQGVVPQVERLGSDQRRVAEQLERLRARGDLPGANELAAEAKALARQLEAGRLDRQTVERQERLFRHMLDAGRTLQGREQDPGQRQSTTARDDSVHVPPALRPELLQAGDQPALPRWEDLQRLSPQERRLVLDYFHRLRSGAAQ